MQTSKCSLCFEEMQAKYKILALPLLGEIFYKVCYGCYTKLGLKCNIEPHVIHEQDSLHTRLQSDFYYE